jgi:hypothetical protein
MGPIKMIEVIEGRRYNTAGAYFVTHLTQWQGERDKLEPITLAEAQELFETLSEKRMTYEEAFPGVTVEEA